MLGIFDSGFGGLTVLRAVRDCFPDLSIVYFGDSARTPYGNRSRDIVTTYTKECCSVLFERGCTLIVLACNTASAETLRELQREWLPGVRGQKAESRAMNILGVIRPLVEEAVLRTRNNRIGVVGTRSTIESQAYVEELKKLKPDVTVIQQTCPLLVPLVEENWIDTPETRRMLRTYLQPLKSHNPDVLILGCTHYETLHVLFQQKMGTRCTVLHSPAVVSEKLADYLQRHPEYELPRTRKMLFLTTGDPGRFREVGEKFYKGAMEEIERVEVSSSVSGMTASEHELERKRERNFSLAKPKRRC